MPSAIPPQRIAPLARGQAVIRGTPSQPRRLFLPAATMRALVLETDARAG